MTYGSADAVVKSYTPNRHSSRASASYENDDDIDDFEDHERQPLKKPAPAAVGGPTKTSKLVLAVVLFMFVFCGTCSTVLSKVLFQCTAIGADGKEKHFGKPLFQNTGMFLGMSLCLVVFETRRRLFTAKATLKEQQALVASGQAHMAEAGSDPRVYYVVIVPALCDFLATYMMNVGLLWINASVWQMVRGSIVLFSALVRWVWLKKKIQNYQWFGVFVVMSALCIIGMSCILSDSGKVASASDVSATYRIFGVLLVFLAQMVQAVQTVVEEHLLHDIRASDQQIVGLEGVWGFALCALVAMPIAYYLPYPGLHEDTIDTFAMLRNNSTVLALFVLYVLVILGYNMFAMKVTLFLDSVTRNVLDTARTMFIWITLTVVHYTYSDKYGEDWNNWSYLQLAGFGVLIFGLFSYYKVITLPCFDYTEEYVPIKEETPRMPMMHSPYMSPKM